MPVDPVQPVDPPAHPRASDRSHRVGSASADRPVVVVGAGISGIACARVLHDAGIVVRVLDRGRRLGGRMAVRTEQLEGGRHAVDIGASYFTVRDDRFAAVAHAWQKAGLAHVWTDTFRLLSPEGSFGTTTSIPRWSAAGGLRSLVEDLAQGLDVTCAAEVSEIDVDSSGVAVDGVPAAAVVLAMPEPQAYDLLPTQLSAALGLSNGRDWSPSIAVWAAWSTPWWATLDGAFVDGSPVLSWVADDGRRRGDGAPVLVAHTTAPFAAARLDDAASAATPVLDELSRVLPRLGGVHQAGDPVPEPLWVRTHRWSLAQPRSPRPELFALHPALVGICGDAWGPKPRVEQAWLSGTLLGEQLVDRLT